MKFLLRAIGGALGLAVPVCLLLAFSWGSTVLLNAQSNPIPVDQAAKIKELTDQVKALQAQVAWYENMLKATELKLSGMQLFVSQDNVLRSLEANKPKLQTPPAAPAQQP